MFGDVVAPKRFNQEKSALGNHAGADVPGTSVLLKGLFLGAEV